MNGEYYFLPLEHIIFGEGSLEKLPEEIKRLGGKRVVIITGNSLANRTGVVKKVVGTLGSLHQGTFSEIRQHTPARDVENALQFARKVRADTLVSVGGGSPIDAAKAVSKAMSDEPGHKMPLHLAIPTTLSAAEFSYTLVQNLRGVIMKFR